MATFILVDASNLFFRIKHTSRGDPSTKAGLGLHMVLNSLRSAWKQFHCDHVVWCLEGHSWRKEAYPLYKSARSTLKSMRTQKEIDEDEIYFQAMKEFNEFLQEKTNVTVLQSYGLEADDFIAGWIDYHPNDKHVIVSGDSDYHQLLSENVTIYDGVNQHTITRDGIVDNYGKPVLDKKTKKPIVIEPEYALFKKIIRGDTSDSIMSAYPGIRENGNAKKPGIIEAFNDRHAKGYDWNSFMQAKWQDPDGNSIRVLDAYERNKMLIDLRQQPEEIKELMKTIIEQEIVKEKKSQVGIWFMKFVGTYDLVQISKSPTEYAQILSAAYRSANNAV